MTLLKDVQDVQDGQDARELLYCPVFIDLWHQQAWGKDMGPPSAKIQNNVTLFNLFYAR
jgi:hypothetical protein